MDNGGIPGMLTREQLSDEIERGEIDTVLTVFPDMYGRLMGKRVTGRFFKERVAADGMHACDYLLACDMEMDTVPGYAIANWERGYGDVHLTPDLETLRRAAWLPRTALVLCDPHTDPGHAPVEVAPRRILQRQLERARAAGFVVMGAAEIELYCFDETYETARAKGYLDLETLGSYIEDYHISQGTKEEGLIGAIRRALDASGVPVESSKGEWGPGQQEINLAYDEALAQADRSVIYKHAAKEIAYAQGKAVTFMAKWDQKHAGSSMHVHLSLRDAREGRPCFPGDEAFGPVRASATFRHFLGGWMRHARELTGFYAPSVNSYKRYQAGSFAPTAIACSYDNRSRGLPRRRRGIIVAHRVPYPGGRRQPVPRLRGVHCGRPGWDRAGDRASGLFRRRRVPGGGLAARAGDAVPGHRGAGEGRVCAARLRPGGCRPLSALPADRAAQVRRGGDILGTGTLLRAGMRTRGQRLM